MLRNHIVHLVYIFFFEAPHMLVFAVYSFVNTSWCSFHTRMIHWFSALYIAKALPVQGNIWCFATIDVESFAVAISGKAMRVSLNQGVIYTSILSSLAGLLQSQGQPSWWQATFLAVTIPGIAAITRIATCFAESEGRSIGSYTSVSLLWDVVLPIQWTQLSWKLSIWFGEGAWEHNKPAQSSQHVWHKQDNTKRMKWYPMGATDTVALTAPSNKFSTIAGDSAIGGFPKEGCTGVAANN